MNNLVYRSYGNWADRLDDKHLILHAGHDSIQHATYLLCGVSDSRLLIKNVPKESLVVRL